jgi:hypothetical protein
MLFCRQPAPLHESRCWWSPIDEPLTLAVVSTKVPVADSVYAALTPENIRAQRFQVRPGALMLSLTGSPLLGKAAASRRNKAVRYRTNDYSVPTVCPPGRARQRVR